MTNFKRGDIIPVPFPFTDLSSAKQRPALVVSSDALNAAGDDVLVAAITSQIAANLTAEEFMIPSGDCLFSASRTSFCVTSTGGFLRRLAYEY